MRRGEGEREQEGGQGYSARSLGTRAFANCLGLPSVWLLLSHAPPLHFTSPALPYPRHTTATSQPRPHPVHVRRPCEIQSAAAQSSVSSAAASCKTATKTRRPSIPHGNLILI